MDSAKDVLLDPAITEKRDKRWWKYICITGAVFGFFLPIILAFGYVTIFKFFLGLFAIVFFGFMFLINKWYDYYHLECCYLESELLTKFSYLVFSNIFLWILIWLIGNLFYRKIGRKGYVITLALLFVFNIICLFLGVAMFE